MKYFPRRKPRIIPASLVRWALLAAFTIGWAADGQEIHELDPYIVEVTRSGEAFGESPVSLSRLDSEAIQRSEQQLTLDESLEGVPGVFILNPFNYAQDTRIAIRGFGARADFGIRASNCWSTAYRPRRPTGRGKSTDWTLGRQDGSRSSAARDRSFMAPPREALF
jgi:iron complex outermembrane receptor protein